MCLTARHACNLPTFVPRCLFSPSSLVFCSFNWMELLWESSLCDPPVIHPLCWLLIFRLKSCFQGHLGQLTRATKQTRVFFHFCFCLFSLCASLLKDCWVRIRTERVLLEFMDSESFWTWESWSESLCVVLYINLRTQSKLSMIYFKKKHDRNQPHFSNMLWIVFWFLLFGA